MMSRSSLKLACVVVAVICCFMAVKEALASDCTVSRDVNGCRAASPATRHRKVLARSAAEEKGEIVAGRWKLREVPLGPDPLHHHGNPPKKPRTP